MKYGPALLSALFIVGAINIASHQIARAIDRQTQMQMCLTAVVAVHHAPKSCFRKDAQ